MAFYDNELDKKLQFLIKAVRELYTAGELNQISLGLVDHRARKLTPFDLFPSITVYAAERPRTFIVSYWGDIERKVFERFEISADELGLAFLSDNPPGASSSR